MSPISLSDDGPKMEKSHSNGQKVEERDSIVSTMSKSSTTGYRTQQRGKERESATQGSVVLTKMKTLKDKSNNSKKTTLLMRSSKTLDQDSTGTEKDLHPFCTESSQELSRKLWLPTKTDCADLDTNSLSKSIKNLAQNSWFSTKMKMSERTQLLKSPFHH